MQAGEEVRAHVIDIGSLYTRAGFAGEDTPRAVVPSYHYVDGDLITPATGTRRETGAPFLPNSGNLAAVLPRQIESVFDIHMRSPAAECPLLITGSPDLLEDPSVRETLTKHLFETCRVPGLFFARSAVLGAFSVGRPSALVLESGHSHTYLTPVIDGYALSRTAVSIPECGNTISARLRTLVEEKTVEHDFKPVYEAKARPGAKPMHESYRAYAVDRLMDEAKETVGVVAKERDAQIATKLFELPDGRVLEFSGAERSYIVEPFAAALPDAIWTVVSSVDKDQVKELLGNIVLAGGNTAWADLHFRMQVDLSARAQTTGAKVKVLGLQPQDRRFSPWVGGSILATLGTFQQMWVSRHDYDEHGSNVVLKKCP
jgi:actin-related protein